MKNKKIFKQTLFAMLLAIEVLLMFTPLGYVPIGVLRITTMHIPVLVGAMCLGIKGGALLGLSFGISSIIYNTLVPTVTSFVFSPFVSVGQIHGNGLSLVVAIVPRVLLGVIAALIYKRLKNKSIAVIVSSGIATFIHTILVLFLIYICFGQPYAYSRGIEYQTLFSVFLTTVFSNGILEIVIAVIINTIVMKLINKMYKI